MENVFIVNPTSTFLALQESIQQKVAQAKAITECLLLGHHELPPGVIYDAIWAVNSCIEQVEQLVEAINL